MGDNLIGVTSDVQAFSVVLNPGDPVLIETPVYAGILPPLKNLQAKTIGRCQLFSSPAGTDVRGRGR